MAKVSIVSSVYNKEPWLERSLKSFLSQTYDVDAPKVVLVYLENAPKKGIGPQDVAIALVGETFKDGFVKNCILEFAGPGVKNLSMDFQQMKRQRNISLSTAEQVNIRKLSLKTVLITIRLLRLTLQNLSQ